MTHTLKRTNGNHFLYPLYYNDIVRDLNKIAIDKQESYYRTLAEYHLKRLEMDYPDGLKLFSNDLKRKRLLTFTDPYTQKNTYFPNISDTQNKTFINASMIIGVDYDYKKYIKNLSRMRGYYGIESSGNFYENFGYYLMFKKGYYFGKEMFIKENLFAREKDGKYYQDDLISELDFKNNYLNLSMGYGSFDIGKTISSSIILNRNVKPYGYFKYYKQYKALNYTGITAQLIPDSPNIPTKAMAIQMLSLHTDYLNVGIGSSMIYGDRVFDLAYSTPLALLGIMNNNYHSKDNDMLYVLFDIKPVSSLNIYANLLFDELKTRYNLSNNAYQMGVLTQLRPFPMEIGVESTVVGAGTYTYTDSLTYRQDNVNLGHEHENNFFSLAGRLRLHFPYISVGLLYENQQQGQTVNEKKFLGDNVIRKEFYKANLELRIIPELNIFTRYEYQI
jgi:hypothetical protein